MIGSRSEVFHHTLFHQVLYLMTSASVKYSAAPLVFLLLFDKRYDSDSLSCPDPSDQAWLSVQECLLVQFPGSRLWNVCMGADWRGWGRGDAGTRLIAESGVTAFLYLHCVFLSVLVIMGLFIIVEGAGKYIYV